MGQPSRRRVLVFAVGAGAAGALAGCGGSGDAGRSAGPASTTAAPTSAAPDTPLGQTGDVPVGGGTVFTAQKVVVTQPAAGEFKAFSAICTHMGCQVGGVANGTINCPCHGSRYSITDGSVQSGPAPRPLAAERITVTGTTISLVG